MHHPIKQGTLSSILKEFGVRHNMLLDEIVKQLRL